MKGCLAIIMWFTATVFAVGIIVAFLAPFGPLGMLVGVVLGIALPLVIWGYMTPTDDDDEDVPGPATREDVR